MYDLLIKNATVFDGLGNPGKKSDVAIQKGKIAAVSQTITQSAKEVIDATGKYLAPGFIDIQNHSDSYWTIWDQPEQLSLISQGITSIVMGNCGSSIAPLANRDSLKTVQKWHDMSGINVDWSSFAEFLQALALRKTSVNVGSLVGHATLRRGLLGDDIRAINPNEIKVMDKLLREALDQGALGLSMGLVYAHEVDSTIAELKELAGNLKDTDKYLSIHLRSEETNILESLDEAIELSKSCGIRLKVSHLKIRGKKNWHLIGAVINRLENAYHQGLDISFDVYPYESSWSVLYTYLPRWSYEGGRGGILARLSDPTNRRKILDHLKAQEYDFTNIIIAVSAGNPAFVGKSIAEIAANQSVSGEEAMLNIITATNAQVLAFDHNLSADHVEAFLTSPLSIVATDGAGYGARSNDLVHPRCFGTMPRFLRMVLDKKIMKMEDAIKKITSEPARIAGIGGRGAIVHGLSADLVIFDPVTIADQADYIHPFKLSQGIETVIVNGRKSFANGAQTDLAGQIIKR